MHSSTDYTPERNLDILRAIAALSVFFSHIQLALNQSGPWLVDPFSLGRAGVLIFFVHTTLVLMLSMERMGETGAALFSKFYIRRAFRIYPLSILTVLLLLIFQIPHDLLGSVFFFDGPILASNVLLVQNLFNSFHLTDTLWSLPFEVQMYLVLPAVFVAFRGPRWAIPFSIVYALSLFGARHIQLLRYVPCFLAGVVAYRLMPRARVRFSWKFWPPVVLTLIAIYIFGFNVSKAFAVFLCLSLGVLIPFFANCPDNLFARAAHLIARYSYGLYLAHYPLMWIFYRKFAAWPEVAKHLAFAACAVAIPIAAYHLVEAPFIKLGTKLSKRIPSSRLPKARAVPTPLAVDL
jgi:peptidoglycan/LPS O-acetylase OafA/YrhL